MAKEKGTAVPEERVEKAAGRRSAKEDFSREPQDHLLRILMEIAITVTSMVIARGIAQSLTRRWPPAELPEVQEP